MKEDNIYAFDVKPKEPGILPAIDEIINTPLNPNAYLEYMLPIIMEAEYYENLRSTPASNRTNSS